jgi:hypothetical protein
MASLPDRPDLRQLRIQAKQLKRALADGDETSRNRILASHPKFAGREPERMEGWIFTLRDAQVVLAREHGFESWGALLQSVEGATVQRWSISPYEGILGRAFKEAQKLHHSFTTGEHLILALLNPPRPTPASEVLQELGLTYEVAAERAKLLGGSTESEGGGTSSTPVYQLISGFAQGAAVGLGAGELTDEHVLLAIVYGDPTGDQRFTGFEVDADEVVAGLKSRGVPVPKLAPPVATTPHGPFGPMVYFPEDDFRAITQEIIKRYPPGTSLWGTNQSWWKPGYW